MPTRSKKIQLMKNKKYRDCGYLTDGTGIVIQQILWKTLNSIIITLSLDSALLYNSWQVGSNMLSWLARLASNHCMQHKKEHFLIDNGQSGSRIVLGMPAMLKSCQMVRVMATPLWGRDTASIRNRIRSTI